MKQRFVAKVFVILLAFVMLFSLCAFTIDAASTNAASQTTTQTSPKPKRKTYTQALEEINDTLSEKGDQGFWRNGVRELKQVKSYDALGATVITQFAKCIKEDDDEERRKLADETLKGVINLIASCYGLGGISNALINAFESFGEQPEDSEDPVITYLGSEFDRVNGNMTQIQENISELSVQVDASTQEILDAFAAQEAKDKVIEFVTNSGSDFNYKRFKNHLYGSSTDASGNYLYYTEAYYDQLVKSLIPKEGETPAPEEIIKANYDALYSSLASNAQHEANIALLYEYLLYDDDALIDAQSVQRYYYDYLFYLSSDENWGERNAEYEALQFALDVYTTALFADHCIEACNNYQLKWIYDTYGSNPPDYAEYNYGEGTITYAQILLTADAIASRQAALEKQMVADVAYILNLGGSVVIQDDNNSLSIMTDDDAGWEYVQLNQTIHLNKLADEWCAIYGFDTDAFSYEWYSNGELIETNDGIFKVDGKYSSFKGVVKYKGDEELYYIEFVVDAPTFVSGTGKETDPYVISCAEQFKLIDASEENMDDYYILVHDIDFTDITFSPIGTEEIPFTGNLNGNGYAIKNLKVTADNYVGVFGMIGEGGVVQNLNVENCEFKSENENVDKVYAGAIAATNAGKIYNCYISNSSIVVDGKNSQRRACPTVFAGGVAGISEGNGAISFCKVENTNISASLYHDRGAGIINSTETYAGGIVASMIEQTMVQSCYVSNSVTLNANANININFLGSVWGTIVDDEPNIKVRAAGVAALFDDITKITNVWSEAEIQTCDYDIQGWTGLSRIHCNTDSDQYVATRYINLWLKDELKNAIKAPSKDAIVFPQQTKEYDITYSFKGDFNDNYDCYAGQLYYCNEKALKTDDLSIQVNGENVEYTVISYYNFDTLNAEKFAAKTSTVLVTLSAEYQGTDVVGKLEIPITIAENSPTGLEVAVRPDKIVYDRGEQVSLDGGSFILRYQDGSIQDVTEYLNPPIYDTSNFGATQVVVSYDIYYVTYDIVVECDHDYYDTEYVPTCYAYGYTLHTCRKCSVSYELNKTDKIAHMMTAQNAVAATCTAPGHTADFVCTMCQQIIVEGEEVPPIGHNFTDAARDAGAHYCTVCNAGEEHLFRTTENETEVICTCVICGFNLPYVQNDRETISQLPRVVVSDAYSLPGSNEVVVYIEFFSDIGITGADFSIYFGNKLKYVSCSKGNILADALLEDKDFGDHINVILSNATAQVVGNNKEMPHTLLKLVFRTPEDAIAGDEYPIAIVNRADVNSKGETVFSSKFTGEDVTALEFVSFNGKIKVVDRLPGDVVGDGTIDLLDAIIISRYSVLSENNQLASRDQFVKDLKEKHEHFDISYGDVCWEKENLRGIYNSKDVTQILRYIVGGYEARLLTKDFYVTFNFNDGTGNTIRLPVSYDENDNIIFENMPTVTRTGYKFDGWYYGFDKAAVQMDKYYSWNENADEQTLYAHYTLNSITFVGNGAEGLMGSISYAKDITAPQEWTVDNKFTKNSTVTFKSQEKHVDDKPVPVSHSFIGWGVPVPDSLPDKPEYVNYDGQRYEIKYRLGQGQSINLKDDEIGNLTLYAIWSTEYIDVPVMTQEGYHVSQWTSDSDGRYFVVDANSQYAVTTSATLFAQWKLTPYTVTWDESEGYSVQVVRTASPNGHATIDEKLDNGATVYYGDVLEITYTNDVGFVITKSGNLSITVTGNVDSSKIFATCTFVPGLYDASGELLVSWDELVYTYGMDVTVDYGATDHNNSATHPYKVIDDNATVLGRGTTLVLGDVDRIGSYAFHFFASEWTMVSSIIIPDSVTSIGDYAFAECDQLTSFTIPDSVTSIGEGAFYYCSSLTSITIPDGITSISDSAFSACWDLTSVTIPDSVTSIGANAFGYCSSLASVVIPDSVTSMGDSAFYGYKGCRKVLYTGSKEDWNAITMGSGVFKSSYSVRTIYHYNCSVAPDGFVYALNSSSDTYSFVGQVGTATEVVVSSTYQDRPVTSIGSFACYNDAGLTSITIPSSVTSIGEQAFYECTNLASVYITDLNAWCNIDFGVGALLPEITHANPLEYAQGLYLNGKLVTEVVLPNSMTTINNAAFYGFKGLASIVIPDSVTSIGKEAFYQCTGLRSVTIGNSVTSIGNNAFRYCTGLTSITVADNNPTYFSQDGILYLKASMSIVCVPQQIKGNVSIPDGVTSIGNSAFSGCTGLTGITIPDSVTSIGKSTFEGCIGLTGITIPDSVTSIGGSVFSGCTGLTSITVADNNPVYHSARNCIIEIESKTLIAGCSTSEIPADGSVTSIGENAFRNCTSLTSITIPDSVTSIGDSAFIRCTGLRSITIGNSVTSIFSYAFYNCTGLTSITIPDGVTGIGSYAFYNCTGLTSITIPDGVTSIGNYVFYNCTGLTSITIPDGVTSIGKSAFEGCTGLRSITIGDSVTSIGSQAFYGCIKLIEVINHSQLTLSLGSTSAGHVAYYAMEIHTGASKIVEQNGYLFYTGDDANYLLCYLGQDTDLKLPDGYNGETYEIYQYAFADCSSLTSITIPDSVTSIGQYAFAGCTGLTSITIPDSVKSIDYAAFNGCTKLARISIPFVGAEKDGTSNVYFGVIFGRPSSGATGMHDYLVPDSLKTVVITGGSIIGDYAFNNCTGLTSITITDSVTSIGDYAFHNCTGLTSITIPDSVTSIGDGAFFGCTSLKRITIPDSVTSIISNTFGYCTSLTSVTIGDGVTYIGGWAFNGCTSLTSVILVDPSTWYRTSTYNSAVNMYGGTYMMMNDDSINAIYFAAQYCDEYWYKK